MAGHSARPAFNVPDDFHEDLDVAVLNPRPMKNTPSTSAHPLSETCPVPTLEQSRETSGRSSLLWGDCRTPRRPHQAVYEMGAAFLSRELVK